VNQQFSYYDSQSSSFDINSGFGSANSSDEDRGRWEVKSDATGNALLLLNYNSGREFEYRIGNRDHKTFLSNTRLIKASAVST
jgi:hypothetical protein